MGWTGYHVSAPVNRKLECNKANSWDEERSSCRVLASAMRGKVWYGACEYTNKQTGESKVFGSVCLTSVDNKAYDNFWIKEMDETMGPCYDGCPLYILDLLTPTENSYAEVWRKGCRERAKDSNRKAYLLKCLPIGSIIRFKMGSETVNAEKCEAAYQFKAPWWRIGDNYIKKVNIPDDFEIVSEGGNAKT